MELTSILFYVFAAVLLFSGLNVITNKNPVHAALYLILAFVTTACMWMMLGAEFLSLTLIVVYVGAVMVLFLFVVMMLDVDLEELRSGFWKHLPVALILGVISMIEMLLVILHKPINLVNNIPDGSDALTSVANANQLGLVMYTQYSFPVELASMVLLLGLVVAVSLVLRKSDKEAKAAIYQNIAKQVKVKAADRFVMVKMDAVVEKAKEADNA